MIWDLTTWFKSLSRRLKIRVWDFIWDLPIDGAISTSVSWKGKPYRSGVAQAMRHRQHTSTSTIIPSKKMSTPPALIRGIWQTLSYLYLRRGQSRNVWRRGFYTLFLSPITMLIAYRLSVCLISRQGITGLPIGLPGKWPLKRCVCVYFA